MAERSVARDRDRARNRAPEEERAREEERPRRRKPARDRAEEPAQEEHAEEPAQEERAEEPAQEERAEEPAQEEEEEAGRPARSQADGLSAAAAAQAGLRQIAELTGKRPEGVTGVEPAEDGWLVSVEVLEDRRVPSSADILALYEAELDPDGSLLAYRRARRYLRNRSGDDREAAP